MRERLTTLDRADTVDHIDGGDGLPSRWPHIGRYLWIDSTGWIEHDFCTWHFTTERAQPPRAEVAAAYEQWADFFEWHLERRADELATDRVKRHIVTKWTDDMAHCCRRLAARARGEDPGEWVPQRERRPDLDTEGRAITDEIVARHAARRQRVERAR